MSNPTIELTVDQIEEVVRLELNDSLKHSMDLEPALESAMILVRDYYSTRDQIEEYAE